MDFRGYNVCRFFVLYSLVFEDLTNLIVKTIKGLANE